MGFSLEYFMIELKAILSDEAYSEKEKNDAAVKYLEESHKYAEECGQI